MLEFFLDNFICKSRDKSCKTRAVVKKPFERVDACLVVKTCEYLVEFGLDSYNLASLMGRN